MTVTRLTMQMNTSEEFLTKEALEVYYQRCVLSLVTPH